MPLYLVLIRTIVAVALVGALYFSPGSRALFGTHEQPARILGRRAQLSEIESSSGELDREQPRLPPATIERFSPEEGYLLRFDASFDWLGRTETHAYVSARREGYPVSLAASWWHRRGVFVHGHFGSGEAFIGALRLV